ncbi:hypothetical protein TNCV_2311871 [Trichonephila clavipes]|nr:hypothetical protein TNCV_2311871 [Trichonephila clavipes]
MTKTCQDQARNGRPSHVEEDNIDEYTIKNPNPTVQELAKTKAHETTVERRLVNSSFTRKLDNWVHFAILATPGEMENLHVCTHTHKFLQPYEGVPNSYIHLTTSIVWCIFVPTTTTLLIFTD